MIRHWTPEEDQAIRDSRVAGVRLRIVAQQLGRTHRAVECRWNKIREIGPAPRPKTPKRDRLLIAMNEAFHRFAETNRMSVDEARALLMGGDRQFSPVPGTETFFKTSAMRRLAA